MSIKVLYCEEPVVSLGNRFEVVSCPRNGRAILDAIDNLRPDVVVLDLVTQELDGFTVMERAKGRSKFIIVTSLNDDVFVSKAMYLGASYYLVKPIDIGALIRAIDDSQHAGFISSKPVAEKSLEEKISNIFMTVGIPANIKGYYFLREAIKISVKEPSLMVSVTKELYPSIAHTYSTTSSKVERAIRHAIEVAWSRGRIESINSLFGVKIYSANDKPTNSEFISLIADKLLLESIS